ncbi:hypothetical protein EB001_16635 [bacterium]|nr:hypothetical protein [bacterium]
MALGPQFKNTHWVDDKGNMQSYVLNTPNEPFKVTQVSGETSTPTQGMLFSPETGTGAKNDPLVPHERRIEAIKKGLGMDDPEKYAKRAGYSMSSNARAKGAPLSKRATNKAIDAYTDALDDSSLSTYEIEKHLATNPVLAIANTNMTRGHIDGGRIRLPYQETYEKVEVPEQVKTVRTGLKLQPIPNPKLAEQVKDVYWDSQDYIKDGVFKIADIATPDGSVFDKSPYYEKNDIPDFRAGYGKHNRGGEPVLPPGHHFNVWPGSGKDVTDPDIVVKKHMVYDGQTEHGESLRTFHTRHKIVGHESSHEEVIPGYVTHTRGKDAIAESSLVHELGHHFDPNLNDLYNQRDSHTWARNRMVGGKPDPAQEGVADGFAYAHVIKKDVSRELLEQGKTDKSFSTYGYSTKFSGFANNTSKALYAAMAAHTAANPRIDDLTQVPSRESLYNKYNQIKPRTPRRRAAIGEITPESRHIANTLLLGYMYDNHEHVRKTLHDLGLGKAGLVAHKFYKENDPTRYKGPEQTKLPGFD